MATNKTNFNYLEYLDKKNVTFFNYVSHINNLPSIMKKGIYSRNYIVSHKIPFFRVDYQKVQNLRIRNIRSKYCLHIHDFVPNFFSSHTPMIYKICNPKGGKKFEGLDSNGRKICVGKNDIAILKINREILSENGVKFSNKNCASNKVEIYDDVKNLEKLCWTDILQKSYKWNGWYSYEKNIYELSLWKLNKSAEILIPENVPTEFIKKIVVYNKDNIGDLDLEMDVGTFIKDKNEFEW